MKHFKGYIILTKEIMINDICKFPSIKCSNEVLPKGLVFKVRPFFGNKEYSFDIPHLDGINNNYLSSVHSKSGLLVSLDKCHKFWYEGYFKVIYLQG